MNPDRSDHLARIEAAILELLGRRPGTTICPSEVARQLDADETASRALMPAVREAARRLAACGRVQVLQRGRRVDPMAQWTGPIRIGSGRH